MATLKLGSYGEEVERLQALLVSNGYCVEVHGRFDDVTREQVMTFQAQHIDQSGVQLAIDGIVGKRTWWALENASGNPQRNHLARQEPDHGLTVGRRLLLQWVYAEHAKPVFEVPDGSNRSPDIDQYWGNTGIKGAAWCCAFVSWALKESMGLFPVGGRHHIGVHMMWQRAMRLGMTVLTPKPGDGFVQLFSKGRGHTGFVVGVSEDGQTIYTCEGNCGNRVKLGRRDVATIDGFIDFLKDGQAPDFKRSSGITELGSVTVEGDETR